MREPKDRLQIARKKAGYQSPGDAARAFGWNLNTYKSHENGIRGISVKAAAKYAKAYHVTSAFILVDDQITNAEAQLMLAKILALSADDRKVVEGVADTLLEMRSKPGAN